MSEKCTFSFYVNKFKKEKNGKLPIYMRLTSNRKKKELDTGYYSSLGDWNEGKGRSKASTIINDGLASLESRFYFRVTEFKKDGDKVNLDILKDYVNNSEVKSTPSLSSYLKEFCIKTQLRNDIVYATKTRFKRTQDTVLAFLKSIKKENVLLSDVDFRFIDIYDSFLREKFDLEPNTLAKYHSRFRTICLKAKNEGLIQINPYANFKIRTVPTNRGYLTLEQIRDIEQITFNNASLDKVRDVFLFSVYTSLRFSDVSSLSNDNLYEDTQRNLNLKFVIEKSGEQISLPLFDKPVKIIKKYENSDEVMIKGKLLPTITNQKTNEYLKVIADLAGIQTKLTYHVARHTFATTIWLGNGGSIQELQKILGHTNIRETMIYGKISPELLKKSFAEINEKIKSGSLAIE